MFLTGFRFLFDGYLIGGVNNPGFLCDGHVTGRGILGKIPLIIKHFLCDGYVTGRQKSLFDGYLTELRFGSVLTPYQVRYSIGNSQTSSNLKAND